MNENEKYIFDLNGYIIIKGVLTEAEVKTANESIDKHKHEAHERDTCVRNAGSGTALSAKKGRIDLGRILQWGAEDSAPFRSILNHPKLIPFYHSLLGQGYRLDHLPFCILQHADSEGFNLHGGTIDASSGEYNHHLSYSCVGQQLRCNLLAVEVILSDHPAGKGGWCVIPGSHKSNFRTPTELVAGGATVAGELEGLCIQPTVAAGDVILFSEATVHGAMPWRNAHERRVALYRFSPPTMAFARAYSLRAGDAFWPQDLTEGMSDGEKAVCQPPFAVYLERKTLDHDGNACVKERNPEKKRFDVEVFGQDFY